MEKQIKERVARGIKWLDKNHKGWEKKIDIKILNMGSAYTCICGQAFNDIVAEHEYGFDYLRDNLATSMDDLVQRKHYFAIVDEVDSILIDEARTPLIISSASSESGDFYVKFYQIAKQLKRNVDFGVDENIKRRN